LLLLLLLLLLSFSQGLTKVRTTGVALTRRSITSRMTLKE